MSYTPVPTQNIGDEWTAAEHNTYARDNFAAGVPDIFTTKGDLAVGTGADAAIRLGVGTNGQFLTADSGEASGLKWVSPGLSVYARYTKDTAQNVATATATYIDFDTEDFDTESAVTVGADWRFIVPVGFGGYYLICACVAGTGGTFSAGQYIKLDVYIDDALYCNLGYTEPNGRSLATASGSAVIYAAAGSEIQLKVTQNSGETVSITGDVADNHVSIARLF